MFDSPFGTECFPSRAHLNFSEPVMAMKLVFELDNGALSHCLAFLASEVASAIPHARFNTLLCIRTSSDLDLGLEDSFMMSNSENILPHVGT